MTQGDALLEAIRDEPDDEGLRLVYADWLEENGDPARSELIRVQCALEHLSAQAPERYSLQTRERELLRRHEKVWLGPLRAGLKWWRFRRGLLEEVSLTVERFLVHAHALLLLGPVCRVNFRGGATHNNRLPDCPRLAQLRAVDLSCNFVNDAAAVALAESRYLGGLRELRLAHNFIRVTGAQALAVSPGLANLQLLDVTDNPLRQVGREALRVRFGERLVS
ncbi:MAG TPA: TIGR02996 domain-containing protein [Gemmataceae bacterium]|nr:TIGR02996 domain-containing protein [Gemmataceae bacterium]